MPSRAEATFLPKMYHNDKEFLSIVSMPFRAETPFLLEKAISFAEKNNLSINALSGWDSISTSYKYMGAFSRHFSYQCPFGLRLHFYSTIRWWMLILKRWVSMPFRAETPFLRSGIFDQMESEKHGINALSGWDSISTVPLQKPRFYAVFGTCFCRYLSEYSDNDHFSCMLTIWTYLIATSTTWIFFSITLILQFVICYFWISLTSFDL